MSWDSKSAAIPDSETTMIPQLLCKRLARSGALVHRIMAVICLGLFTVACASAPDQLIAGTDPADPSIRVPSTRYHPVLSGYVSQRPVAPKPWREQNDSVAPARER